MKSTWTKKGSSQNYQWFNRLWASYSGLGSTAELHCYSSFQGNGSFCLHYVDICIFISSWLLGMGHKTTLSTIEGPIHNVTEKGLKLYFYKSTLKLKIDQSEALCLLKHFEKVAPRAPFIDTKISVTHGCVGLLKNIYMYTACICIVCSIKVFWFASYRYVPIQNLSLTAQLSFWNFFFVECSFRSS